MSYLYYKIASSMSHVCFIYVSSIRHGYVKYVIKVGMK